MFKKIYPQIIAMVFLVAALAVGCNDNKDADRRIAEARVLSQQGRYSEAKTAIDSLRSLYPRDPKTLKEALSLMREVDMLEAERNIAFCDSLLPLRKEEAVEASKGFILEKDSLYDEVGKYIWKQLTVERNVEKSYIRCGVNETGEIYLASVYFGRGPINHTGIKFSLADGLSANTASIPYDGGVNYRFTDNGNTTEIVNYVGDNGINAVKFICDNTGKRIKAEYTGGKPYSIYIDEATKRGVAATYQLAAILSDINNLTTELDRSKKRKAYLESKLSTDSLSSIAEGRP
jgi:hypothetical protein